MNPFVVGAYVSRDYFCGRSEEAKELEKSIREGRNVVLCSERELGKTHLINHLFCKASFKEEFECLCVDAAVCGSLKEFAFILVNGIFRSLRNDHGSFEKLASFRDADGARALGNIIESNSSVRMIFSVCETQGCFEQFLEKHGVVCRSTKLIHLGPIELSEYLSFARKKFQEAGKRISAEIFESVYSKFSGCTGPIQLVLNRLFSETPKNASVTNEILDTVIKAIADEYAVFYKEALSRLSFNQKCLVFAVAKDGAVENPSSSEFVNRHSLASVSSVQSSARALLEQGVLHKDDSGLSISDYFFFEWLKKEYF